VVLTGWRPRRLGPAKAVSRQNGARDEDSARITQEDQAWDQTNDLMAHLTSTGQNHCAEVLVLGGDEDAEAWHDGEHRPPRFCMLSLPPRVEQSSGGIGPGAGLRVPGLLERELDARTFGFGGVQGSKPTMIELPDVSVLLRP